MTDIRLSTDDTDDVPSFKPFLPLHENPTKKGNLHFAMIWTVKSVSSNRAGNQSIKNAGSVTLPSLVKVPSLLILLCLNITNDCGWVCADV